jgi:hypothetical protein
MKRNFLALISVFAAMVTSTPGASATTTIGGIANSDLVLTKSQSPYVLSSTLQIPAGIKVTVEAGVEVQSNGLDTMFWNQGILDFQGTRENPIRLSGKPNLYISTKNSDKGSKLNIRGVLFFGGGNIFSSLGYGGYYDLVFEDCEVRDLQSYIYVWYPTNKAVIQRNVFSNSSGLSIGFSENKEISVLNNLFIGASKSGYWVEVWASYGGSLQVHQNEFRGGPYIAVQLKPDYGDINLNASSNYWPGINNSDIPKMVNDKNDGLSYKNIIDISNPLTSAPTLNPSNSILEKESFAEKAIPENALSLMNAKYLDMQSKYPQTQLIVFQSMVDKLNEVWKAGLNNSGYADFLKNTNDMMIRLSDFEKKNPIKVSITCVKGKSTKKITALVPKCPTGYKEKQI